MQNRLWSSVGQTIHFHSPPPAGKEKIFLISAQAPINTETVLCWLGLESNRIPTWLQGVQNSNSLMNTSYFQVYFGSLWKSMVCFYCRGTAALPAGQGKEGLEQIWLITHRGIKHYQLQTKDRKNNPVRKGVGRQEHWLHAQVCAGGQNTRVNKSLFPDQPVTAVWKWMGTRVCSSCFANVEGTDWSPADKESSVWQISRSNYCWDLPWSSLWLWSSCPEGIPQPALGKAISLTLWRNMEPLTNMPCRERCPWILNWFVPVTPLLVYSNMSENWKGRKRTISALKAAGRAKDFLTSPWKSVV